MSTQLTKKDRSNLVALLNDSARLIRAVAAGEAIDPAELTALADSLLQQSSELDPKQAGADKAATGKTVTLKYAYQKLSGDGFIDDGRFALTKLLYQGQPVSVIYADLQRIDLKNGERVTGLGPGSRLERP